jgi:hypothetical protein
MSHLCRLCYDDAPLQKSLGMNRRLMKSSIASLAFVCLLGASAGAEVVVDQASEALEWIAYYQDYPGDYLAQTFTVGQSGVLAEVGMDIRRSGYSHYKDVTDDLLIRITRTDAAGYPATNEVLASTIIDRWQVPHDAYSDAMLKVNLLPFRVPVQAGDKLAIVMSSNQTWFTHRWDYDHYYWYLNPYNPYPGGEMYIYSPQLFGPLPFARFNLRNPEITRDAGFRTLVLLVPEPSAAVQLAALVLLVGVRTQIRQ